MKTTVQDSLIHDCRLLRVCVCVRALRGIDEKDDWYDVQYAIMMMMMICIASSPSRTEHVRYGMTTVNLSSFRRLSVSSDEDVGARSSLLI